MFKKIWRFLSSVLFYSVLLILVIAVLMFVASFVDKKIAMKNGSYRSPLFGAYIIISESMIPSINVYDAVLTVRVSEDDIEKYDIITFLSKDIETAGTPITHRVVDIVHDQDDESKIIGYRTKGDHNNTSDFALIAPDEVIGKVFFRIPMVGYLQSLMTKPIGWLIIVVIPCLLIIGSDIFKLVKKPTDTDDILSDSNGVNNHDDINNNFNSFSVSLTDDSPIFDVQEINTSTLDSANEIDVINQNNINNNLNSVSISQMDGTLTSNFQNDTNTLNVMDQLSSQPMQSVELVEQSPTSFIDQNLDSVIDSSNKSSSNVSSDSSSNLSDHDDLI